MSTTSNQAEDHKHAEDHKQAGDRTHAGAQTHAGAHTKSADHPPPDGHHAHHGHEEQHMQSPAILTDIVIGMSDGLTVPFALAAGLSGAVPQSQHHLIWIAGLAEIAAGSIAMGLGGYLAGRTEVDHYNSELRRE